MNRTRKPLPEIVPNGPPPRDCRPPITSTRNAITTSSNGDAKVNPISISRVDGKRVSFIKGSPLG